MLEDKTRTKPIATVVNFLGWKKKVLQKNLPFDVTASKPTEQRFQGCAITARGGVAV